MCSDSLATGGGLSFGAQKIYRIGKIIAGFAGTLDCIEPVVLWIREGCDPANAPKAIKKVDFMLIDGRTIRAFDGNPLGYTVTTGFFAVGSGAQGAMVASQFTTNLKDIIKAVSKIDPNTGGRIVSRRIRT